MDFLSSTNYRDIESDDFAGPSCHTILTLKMAFINAHNAYLYKLCYHFILFTRIFYTQVGITKESNLTIDFRYYIYMYSLLYPGYPIQW